MCLQATKPPKGDLAYRQLWAVVDRAVRDAFDRHPEYLTEAGKEAAVMSVNKRVVGSVVGHLAQRQLAVGTLRGADDLGHVMLRAMVDVLLLHVQPQEFVAELRAAFPNAVGS